MAKSKRPKPPGKPKRTGFSPPVKVFIAALIDNPNITRAYLKAYPNSGVPSAATGGGRLLRIAEVAKAVEDGRRKRLEAFEMDGDEAMRRIALIAKLDMRELYDHEGKVRPVQEWPAGAALAVKSIKEKEWGTEITFDSRLGALQLVAQSFGKLKNQVEVTGNLAELIGRHARREERE